MIRKKEDKREVTCKHCNHKWPTTSETVLVTCAGCGKKTPNKIVKISKKEVE